MEHTHVGERIKFHQDIAEVGKEQLHEGPWVDQPDLNPIKPASSDPKM